MQLAQLVDAAASHAVLLIWSGVQIFVIAKIFLRFFINILKTIVAGNFLISEMISANKRL
jgi:hypothetical protein